MLDPAADELMVRMVASGVCGTDVHAVSGEQPIPRFPVVLGHEGAGVVEKVGPGVVGFVPGDHVVIALYADCGRCRQCIRGRVDECDSDWRRAGFIGIQGDGRSRIRQSDDEIYPMFGVGTLAEYTTIRAGQAVRIDPDLPLESMCLTACGVATGLGRFFTAPTSDWVTASWWSAAGEWGSTSYKVLGSPAQRRSSRRTSTMQDSRLPAVSVPLTSSTRETFRWTCQTSCREESTSHSRSSAALT